MTEAGWTRKKPTEAGWYWYREGECYLFRLHYAGNQIFVTDFGGTSRRLADCDGEWLGPITPDSYQQGRVASCEWKYDDMDDYYETACKNAYCLADGTLKDNDHKYCPYCGGLIQLVQQAQEGGVGDAGR